jgi:ABC-type sulfate transport system permease component
MEVKPEIEVMLEQVILDQMLLGIIVVNLVLLLLLPFLLMMAGIGAAMLLWFVTSAAVLGALAFWLLFSGTYGLAARVLVLVIGLLLVDRQSRHSAY